MPQVSVDLEYLAGVQIVDVSQEPGQKMKVACSIKLVDQREGTDLDPSNTKYQPRGEGAQGGSRGPITANAAVAKGRHGPSALLQSWQAVQHASVLAQS